MLATPVIATGITHLTDARYFAAWEVSHLAFPLGGAEGLDWTTLNALREWITGPELMVEVDGSGDPTELIEQLRANDIHRLLLPNTAPAASQKQLADAGVELFIRVPVAGYQSLEDIREALAEEALATAVILDFEAGGITWSDLQSGHPFSATDLAGLLEERRVYLEISLGDADPKAFATTYPIAGFAMRGSNEEKVGYKSYDDLDPLFEGLETFE